MSKTIKFNLICNQTPIRTVEDLQENFVIEDILEYYNSGLLSRWLNVRGYDTYLNKVNAIKDSDPLLIVTQLIKIFEIESNENKLSEAVHVLTFRKEYFKACQSYMKNANDVKGIVSKQINQYYALTSEIKDDTTNMPILKAKIKTILNDYYEIFKIDHRRLFNILFSANNILAIMCLLMYEKSRQFYLPAYKCPDAYAQDTDVMYSKINSFIRDLDGRKKLKSALGSNITIFTGTTDEYWKDLEPCGKKCMVLYMDNGNLVRSEGKRGEEYSSKNTNENFLILDGIDYKGRYASDELIYMEV